MMLSRLFCLFVVFQYVRAVGVIIPLHHGPGDGSDCSGWAGYIKSFNEHPGVISYSIVNPEDGPGPSAQPAPEFRACIPLLRPRTTSVVLGYIDTEKGRKAESAVRAEIDRYAGWDREYRPTGIYFDSSASSASRVALYGSYAGYARNKEMPVVALGAGQTPDSTAYFDFADFVTTYESSYSAFRSADIVVSSSSPASKQTVIITEAPPNGSYSRVLSILKDRDVRAAFVTELADGIAVPAHWDSFIAALDESSQTTAGESTSSSTSSSTATPQPSANPADDRQGSSTNAGAIAGGVVGGLVAGIIAVSVVLLLRRNSRRKRMTVTSEVSPYQDYTGKTRSSPPLSPVRGPPADYSQHNHQPDTQSESPSAAELSATMGLSGSSWTQPQGSALASSWGGESSKGGYGAGNQAREETHRLSDVSSVPPPLYSEGPSAV